MKKSGFFKRFLCLTMACVMLALPSVAATVDLGALSNEEIVELLAQVNAEIVSRGISKTAKLPQGAYIGGTDLPAGKYIYTCLAAGDDWGNVTVYTEKGKGKQVLWEVVSAPKEGEDPATIFVTLNEGDQLKSGVPFSLTIMPGAIFQ